LQLLAGIELRGELQDKTLSHGNASQFPKGLGKDAAILARIKPCSVLCSFSKPIERC
jgi:hypothetical protein